MKHGGKLSVENTDPTFSCLRYLINIDGARVPAYATHDLRAGDTARDILLVKETEADALVSRLAKHEELSLRQLKHELVRHADSRPSAIERVKALVNDVADDAISIPSVGIAVYKFGPVGATVLDDRVSYDDGVGIREFRIAIYPDRAVRGPNGYRPAEMRSRAEFVRSLRIRLDRMLQTYFEDIGELLYDLEHHRSQEQGAANAREAREILSMSVASKLDAALSAPRRLSPFDARATVAAANDLRDLYFDWLVTASYAEAFVQWALARYWEALGIDHNSNRLEQRLIGRYLAVAGQMPRDSEISFVKKCPEIVDLHAGATPVFNNQSSEFQRVLKHPARARWVKNLLNFVGYVEFMHDHRVPCHRPRIFLSAHHDVPISGAVERHINDFMRSRNVNMSLINVQRDASGKRSFFEARTGIGISDACITVVPKSLDGIAHAPERNYQWAGREAEHALLLGTRLLPLVQAGCDNDVVLADFAKTTSYLAPRAVPSDRMTKVVDVFTQHAFRTIAPEVGAAINSELADSLQIDFDASALARATTAIRAALQRFHPRFQEVIARTHDIARYPKTRSEIANKLCKNHERAMAALRRTLVKVDEFPLTINGDSYLFIVDRGDGTYQGGVDFILHAILPKLSDTEVETLGNSILAPFVMLGHLDRYCRTLRAKRSMHIYPFMRP
jgi:hypothetical protein